MTFIAKPIIRSISLEHGLAFSGKGYIAQEKKDGVFELLVYRGSVIAGERMPDGGFWAFDLAICQGDDCRHSPLAERLDALRGLADTFEPGLRMVPSGVGGEFLESVLDRGGEGVVFKHLEGYWGSAQFKCKRVVTFDVRVTEILDGEVAISFDGANAGAVPIASRLLQRIQPGDWIEIAARRRNLAGQFLEPRFIRLRPDKSQEGSAGAGPGSP